MNGPTGAVCRAPCAMAKHGILGLTKTAAVEYVKDGVRINAVCPGLVDTPLTARAWALMDAEEPDRAREQVLDMIPAGRMATADEVADTIAWLWCEAPAYITGGSLGIDGGLSIQG